MSRHGVDVPPDVHVAFDVLSLLSKKWHPVVVAVLLHRGPTGFNALLEAIPDVSGKVLSETLDDLEEADVVERTVVSESPLRVEYGLTDAGRDVEPILEALATWGTRHLESAGPTVVLADADRRLTGMYGGWIGDRYAVVRAHSGDELRRHLEDADVVVFDETLPGVDAREVSAVDAAFRTIVVVGDRPDVDLLEIDCDDVLRKPVVRETLLEAIDAQLDRRDDPPEARERAALAARLALLESVHSRERLDAAEPYVEARRRLEELDG